MEGETDLDALLERLCPEPRSATFVFCTVDLGEAPPDALAPFATIRESEGLTLVVTQEEADAHALSYTGTFRCITLQVHSSLHAVGLTAAVSSALAQQSISANMIAGFYHDHLFVPAEDIERALACLEALSSVA